MGGHGGLNILPQKRWNVYNFDNREKVRKDEEAAAREEQLKREQSRRQEFEFRLQALRQARGHPQNPNPNPNTNPSTSDSNHINLFENLADFSSLGSRGEKDDDKVIDRDDGGRKRKKREERPPKAAPAPMTAEDEKYRLGYGLMGKGVKAPWYLSKPEGFDGGDDEGERVSARGEEKRKKSSGGKKSIEELREERMRREKKEKERERALLAGSKKGADRGFSRGKSRLEVAEIVQYDAEDVN